MSRMRNRAMASRAMVGVILAAAGSAWAQDAHELAFTLTGEGLFGFSIAGAGDVNGDGVPDFAVGAPNGQNEDGTPVGRAFVFSGADASLLLDFEGEFENEGLGNSVSGGVDVNNDGVPDIVVGGPGNNSNGFLSGFARVFSGADGSVIHEFEGDFFTVTGLAVVGLRDLDSDGNDDFGFTFQANSTAPRSVRVISGQEGTEIFTVTSSGTDDDFGRTLARAGDVDGDGLGDFIVGARDGNFARVFAGADGSELFTFTGQSEDAVVSESDGVSGAGDLDGDGFGETIVGFPGAIPGSVAGRVVVFSGDDGSEAFALPGRLADDGAPIQFGSSVAATGDLSGDGVPDVLVGARRDDTNGARSGSVRAFSGADGSELFAVYGEPAEGIGWATENLGDIDDDGIDDFITSNRGGVVKVFVSASADDCPADLTGPGGDGVPDGTLTSDDFFFYLGLFADGDPQADLTGPGGDGEPDGSLTSDDFFFYLGLFAQGCP